MRLFPLALAAALAPGLLSAETFRTAAPVGAVTIYPTGALVTRGFEVALPAGTHEVEIALPPGEILDLDLFGAATVTGQSLGQGLLRPREYDTPEIAAARDAMEAAEDALRAIDREISAARDQIAAIDGQIAFLRSISGGSDQLSASDNIAATLDLIGARLPALLVEKGNLDERIRQLSEDREEAELDLIEAQRAFAAASPPTASFTLLTIAVEVPEATTFSGAISSMTGEAAWSPVYDIALDTETGEIAVSRRAEVQKYSAGDWRDVALTLSTVVPDDRLEPSPVFPDIVRFGSVTARSVGGGPVPAPMVMEEADMVTGALMMEPAAEAASFTGSGAYDGAAFVFSFDRPQSISGAKTVELALDDVSLDAEVVTIAVPRRDETAFIVAEVTNDSGGPLLAGRARMTRDGTFMGETFLDEIADGAEATLPFGADPRIRLAYVVADRMSGDRGIISRSDTREEVVELKVENLTDEDREVRVLHALPVSEQDDMVVRIDTDPDPDARDVDDKRGVARWTLDVPAGGEEVIEIAVDLSWPDGQTLDWRP